MENGGQESNFQVRVARSDDLELYLAHSRAAQQRIRQRGLAQYVPAAHDAYRDAMQQRIDRGTLYVVEDVSPFACVPTFPPSMSAGLGESDSINHATLRAAAFFNLEQTRSEWWQADLVPAAYLAGMVVASQWSGRGVGRWVVAWCLAQAVQWRCFALRLDCHAGNAWLRNYYESLGFELRGYVAMQPGYDGCLYERPVSGFPASFTS
ncbi:MAG: GNAT family N-acetyltransferase [Pirellulales bacterium]